MKNKKIIIIAAAVLTALPAVAQSELQDVLRSVERNNLSLRSEAYAVEGRSYEARMGNSLEPLSVGYSSIADAPQELGKKGELEVSQEFEMPMLYAARSRMAKAMTQQYETEYLAMRQQILLEAKEIYIELCILRMVSELNAPRLAAAQHIMSLYDSRYSTQDATLVDKNRTEFEYLLLREELSAVDIRRIELTRRLTALNGGVEIECSYRLSPAEALMPLDALLTDWEEYAPELTASRLREEVALAEVKVSRRQALPKVEIGYKYEYGEGERFNGFTAGLGIPIFSNRHNVKRAEAYHRAARAAAEEAAVEVRNAVTELYTKVGYLQSLLASFGIVPDAGQYTETLGRLLEAGQISIVEYYSDLDTFYRTLETRLNTELQYRLGLARLDVIYM